MKYILFLALFLIGSCATDNKFLGETYGLEHYHTVVYESKNVIVFYGDFGYNGNTPICFNAITRCNKEVAHKDWSRLNFTGQQGSIIYFETEILRVSMIRYLEKHCEQEELLPYELND